MHCSPAAAHVVGAATGEVAVAVAVAATHVEEATDEQVTVPQLELRIPHLTEHVEEHDLPAQREAHWLVAVKQHAVLSLGENSSISVADKEIENKQKNKIKVLMSKFKKCTAPPM